MATGVTNFGAKGFGAVGFGILLAIPFLSWRLFDYAWVQHAWLAVLVITAVFVSVCGRAIVGLWRGALIDQRNVISLSRLQMVVWTLLFLSGYTTAGLFNIYIGTDDPLAIQIPSQLWALIGISTVSLVGSPLLLSSKTKEVASPDALHKTTEQLIDQGGHRGDVEAVGKLLTNVRPDLARWSDMFTGDETANGAHLDVAKLQMFFFTVLVALTYLAVLWRTFSSAQPDGIMQLPDIDSSMVALIGISHAGYLSSKAVPRR